MDDYVVTTPIDPNRVWTLKYYKRGIESLNPLPKKVGIVTSEEVFDKYFSNNNLYEFVHPHPSESLYVLDRIAKGRELLKRWFIREREEDWQLWVDSDIELEENAVRKIINTVNKENALGYRNGYRGREKRRNWHGAGCLLVNRKIADLAKFFRGKGIDEEGNDFNVSEDLSYIGLLRYLGKTGMEDKFPSYDRLIIAGDAAKVKHYIEKGEKDVPWS